MSLSMIHIIIHTISILFKTNRRFGICMILKMCNKQLSTIMFYKQILKQEQKLQNFNICNVMILVYNKTETGKSNSRSKFHHQIKNEVKYSLIQYLKPPKTLQLCSYYRQKYCSYNQTGKSCYQQSGASRLATSSSSSCCYYAQHYKC